MAVRFAGVGAWSSLGLAGGVAAAGLSQGITGKKTEYRSIPYRSITHFSVEMAGHFDIDPELKIRLSGTTAPIEKTFTKDVDIYEVQAILTQFVAK